jgi:hypothetical protein
VELGVRCKELGREELGGQVGNELRVGHRRGGAVQGMVERGQSGQAGAGQVKRSQQARGLERIEAVVVDGLVSDARARQRRCRV